jgi:hypothetical protein
VSHHPEEIASDAGNLGLQPLETERTPLCLDLLSRCGFPGVARATEDIGESGHLVDQLLELVALDVELLEDGHDLVDRPPGDRLLERVAATLEELLSAFGERELAIP